jgi:hypothetical protein
MMYNRKVFIAAAIAACGTVDARMLQSQLRLVKESNDDSIGDSKPSTNSPIVQDNPDSLRDGDLRQSSVESCRIGKDRHCRKTFAENTVRWSRGFEFLKQNGNGKSHQVAVYKLVDSSENVEVNMRFRKWLKMANDIEAWVLKFHIGNDTDEVRKVQAISAAASNLRGDKWSVGGGGGRFGGLFGKDGTNKHVMMKRQALLKTWYNAWKDFASHQNQDLQELRTDHFKDLAKIDKNEKEELTI